MKAKNKVKDKDLIGPLLTQILIQHGIENLTKSQVKIIDRQFTVASIFLAQFGATLTFKITEKKKIKNAKKK